MARSLGISVKRFLGWEPTTTVTHEYETGLRVRSTETREAEWDDEQRGWMLALSDLEDQSCPGCGGWLAHTTSIEMSDNYIAEHPLRCHRCEALAVRRKTMRDKPNVEALTVWPVHEKGG